MKAEIYSDGACRGNPGKAGIGIIIKQGEKILLEVSDYINHTTNNIAEYMAFIRALEEALILGITEVTSYADSELMVRQIKGEYQVKNEGLKPLFIQAKSLIKRFHKFSIHHVLREKNKRADELANKGIDDHPH